MWINWALKEFELMGKSPTDPRHVPPNGGGDGGKLAKAFTGLSGSQLTDLTIPQLAEKFKASGSTAAINVNFLTHFELLKTCHEVCKCLFGFLTYNFWASNVCNLASHPS